MRACMYLSVLGYTVEIYTIFTFMSITKCLYNVWLHVLQKTRIDGFLLHVAIPNKVLKFEIQLINNNERECYANKDILVRNKSNWYFRNTSKFMLSNPINIASGTSFEVFVVPTTFVCLPL